METYHISVLLQETLEALTIKPERKYIDGTLGGGGHTFEVLKRGGIVLGIDQDQDALDFVEKDLRHKIKDLRLGEDITLVKGNFKDIDVLAKEHKFENVAGILLDLGISSHHVDVPERGFSFQKDGPLDMRMDQELQVTAADLINGLTKQELVDLFSRLGEERFSKRIAERIVEKRKSERIVTTTQLADIIRKSVPFSKKEGNPATRVFQALRIATNDELGSLIEALPKAVKLLEPGGRLAIISFHSLEDRIVKRAFLEFAEKGFGKIITKKPIVPSEEEIRRNTRSRSSKLRVFEKI